MLRLFTLVCDFDGGTYVSQTEATDVLGAIGNWLEKLRVERPIPRSSTHIANRVVRDLAEPDGGPTPLSGLKGVWYIGGAIGGKLFTVNIVRSV